MLKLVVCIKQVPMVTELPWDEKNRVLKREMAEGMMNPACKHALDAALRLKQEHSGYVTVITMGPPMAEEVLREAVVLGTDRGILLSDKQLAGADTFATSRTLAHAIRKFCPDFDLVLCGCYTSDSETGQVGPQLAEELGVPGIAYVEQIKLKDSLLTAQRVSDNFLETLEMDLPGLITVCAPHNPPRYLPLAGIEDAFRDTDIITVNINELGIDPHVVGIEGSPTKIITVYSPKDEKRNVVMKGTAKKIVDQLLEQFTDKISAAIEKDLGVHE